jgi:NhaP-type Na+/H+ or K+/H+ antiporter
LSLTGPALAVDTGFTFGEPFALALVGFAFALWAGIAALSHQSERAFSASIIYLLLGLVAAATLALLGAKPLDPVAEPSLLEHLSEVALIIAVFTTGLSLEANLRWRTWRKVAVLLAIVMPLTIAAVALFGMMAMGLSLGASILLGALLAPTDPVLAGDVGVGSPGEEALQREPRLSLSAEAGLNDGLAAPFLLLGILVAGNETGAIARWLVADVLYAVGVAIVVGAVGGYLAAAGSVRLRDRRFLDERLGLYAAVPIALGVYGLAELVASYGLVAAFVGGLAFRRYDFGHEINRRAYDGAEVVEKFTELTVILLLGSIVTLSGLSAPGPPAGCSPALAAADPPRPRRGPARALGPFAGGARLSRVVRRARRGRRLLRLRVVASGVLRPGEERTVFWTAVVCVAISIFLHGTTATAVSRRLLSQA